MIPGLVERIRAGGPIPFAAFMEAALYDPVGGFYAAGGRAGGRSGQFLTSPEVGPLFGAVLARALDAWWADAGRVEAAHGVVQRGLHEGRERDGPAGANALDEARGHRPRASVKEPRSP